MGLVHDTEGNLGFLAVLLCQLLPYVCQLRIGRSTLANNLAVPSSIVVNVEDTQRRTRAQAPFHEAIVLGEVVGVQLATELIVEQKLPADGKTESIERVVLDEVIHLPDPISYLGDIKGLVRSCQGTCSID